MEDLSEFAFNLNFLIYNLCDIFMVMYFGNEIKLASERLSYSLFESNWPDRSQSCKKRIIFFCERLKRPKQQLILKIYPMTLETFTRVMFDIRSVFQNDQFGNVKNISIFFPSSYIYLRLRQYSNVFYFRPIVESAPRVVSTICPK